MITCHVINSHSFSVLLFPSFHSLLFLVFQGFSDSKTSCTIYCMHHKDPKVREFTSTGSYLLASLFVCSRLVARTGTQMCFLQTSHLNRSKFLIARRKQFRRNFYFRASFFPQRLVWSFASNFIKGGEKKDSNRQFQHQLWLNQSNLLVPDAFVYSLNSCRFTIRCLTTCLVKFSMKARCKHSFKPTQEKHRNKEMCTGGESGFICLNQTACVQILNVCFESMRQMIQQESCIYSPLWLLGGLPIVCQVFP